MISTIPDLKGEDKYSAFAGGLPEYNVYPSHRFYGKSVHGLVHQIAQAIKED
jgi:hypothetical protein